MEWWKQKRLNPLHLIALIQEKCKAEIWCLQIQTVKANLMSGWQFSLFIFLDNVEVLIKPIMDICMMCHCWWLNNYEDIAIRLHKILYVPFL